MATNAKKLRKYTSSLQSMIMMHENKNDSVNVGQYLTFFYHTDIRSEKIVAINGNTFTVENGHEYLLVKGKIKAKSQHIEFLLGTTIKAYVAAGGQYNGIFPCTLIEGLTKIAKVTTTYNNARITDNDESYTDPSF